MTIPLILLALLGAATAAAVAWTVAAERRAADLQRTLAATETALAAARASLATAQQGQAALRASLEAEQRNAAEKLAVLEQAREALKDSFAAISADMLSQNNARFLDLAKEKLGEFQQGAITDLDVRQKAIAELVQPLRDSLTKVDSKLQDVDRDRATSHAALAEQLRSLAHAQLGAAVRDRQARAGAPLAERPRASGASCSCGACSRRRGCSKAITSSSRKPSWRKAAA